MTREAPSGVRGGMAVPTGAPTQVSPGWRPRLPTVRSAALVALRREAGLSQQQLSDRCADAAFQRGDEAMRVSKETIERIEQALKPNRAVE